MSSNDWEALAEIQSEISVPKDKYNEFGKFSYRSYEDIVEAVKPICKNHGATLIVTDSIDESGGWHYVKATASIKFWEGGTIEVSAFARESESKKGSDVSQITGMASTYARKYALCGLFSIDGQDDADAMDNTPQKPNKRATKPNKQNQVSAKRVFWEMLQEEARKLGQDPKQGAEHMKTWSNYEDTEQFYQTMVHNLESSPMDTMAALYPDSIQEEK